MIEPLMIGMGIGLAYTPLWYAVAYIIDRLWEAFRPEVEI